MVFLIVHLIRQDLKRYWEVINRQKCFICRSYRFSGVIADFSSKGPVKDGRIKPEISAMGKRVVSAGLGSYWYNNGTSMASPGVTGGLTLLYQLYKQTNGGSNPKSGLMKAIICNSSRDMGNTGPDFSYGFWLAGSSKGRFDNRKQQVFYFDHCKRDTK